MIMKLPYISTILIIGECCSATATIIEAVQKLVETGFKYVTEIDGVKLFRKRK